MPGDPGATVVTNSCGLSLSHARLRVHRAPGIPHALILQGRRSSHSPGAFALRECGMLSLRHCLRQTRSVCAREQRDEAIQLSVSQRQSWIASLALALTVRLFAFRLFEIRS